MKAIQEKGDEKIKELPSCNTCKKRNDCSPERKTKKGYGYGGECALFKLDSNLFQINQELREVNLHGLSKHQAKDIILKELKRALGNEKPGLRLIHGHSRGHKIMAYIQDGSLADSLHDREDYEVDIIPDEDNPGATCVVFKENND